MQARVAVGPGLDAERVVVACLRDNEELCRRSVPRDLIEQLGRDLDAETDPSAAPQLEFFQVFCQPTGVDGKTLPRNQAAALDVLLSDRLARLRSAINASFFSLETSDFMRPDRILRLLSATICQGNIKCATKLQAVGFSIKAVLGSAYGLMTKIMANTASSSGTPAELEAALVGSEHFCAFIEFLANQFEVIKINPCRAVFISFYFL